MGLISRGMYTTACEASPHKQQIDMWLNEGKANAFISRELKKQFGEEISEKSVAKYRGYREEFIQKSLLADPIYQGKVQDMNQTFIDGVAKIKEVDVLAHLADTIENCADMIQDAKDRDIQIKTVQDIRFMQMTMLDAIKLYGDTLLKAQRFNAVQENPELLQHKTINVNIKSALTDVLKEAMNGGGLDIIDRLRASIGHTVGGGHTGDTGGDRSGIVDGAPQSTEG